MPLPPYKGNKEACMRETIKKLIEENKSRPEKDRRSHDQILAIAYDHCKAK